jgi:hypothetical protein
MSKKSSKKSSDDEDETCRQTHYVDGITVEQNSVDHVSRPVSPTSEEASKRAAVMSVDFDAILKQVSINFINILQKTFSFKNVLCSFYLVMYRLAL